LVKRGALENRLDPKYAIREKFNSKYPFKKFSDLLQGNPMYGANESAIEGNPQTDIRYIRITDIDEYGNLKTDSWKTAEKIDEKYLLKSDDIVFARSGATAGKALIFRKEMQKSIFAGYLIKFSIDEDKVLPDYIFYFTQTEFYQSWVNSIQRPSGQPNINSEEFKNLKIPVPSFEIQSEIVAIFNQAYAEKRQKEAEAKELLASIDVYLLEQLAIILPDKIEEKNVFYVPFSKVQGNRFDPFYHKDEFEINNDAILKGKYKVETIKEICKNLIKGRLPKDSEKDGSCKVVQINSVKIDGSIDLEDLLTAKPIFIQNQLLQENDVLIVITGATIGKISFWQYEGEYYLGGDIVKFQCNEGINPYYIYSYLRTQIIQTEIKRNITGATNGHLSPSDINNFQIPLPPHEIQTEIANHIRNIREQAKTLENEAKEVIEKAKAEVEKMILGE
jgi:restriction endonuclease S subunit